MATDSKNVVNDKILRLKKYADNLKQRLSGQLDKELRFVLEIDLKKTEAKLATLA